jgi:hypothetical protein
MRSLAPAPERAIACARVHALAQGGGELDGVVAWPVAHDRVTMALWALSLHGEDRSVETATRRPLRTTWDPPRDMLRAAAVDATATIAAKIAVDVVFAEGTAPARSRAQRWKSFDDAPFYVVVREVLGRDTFRSRAPLASP